MANAQASVILSLAGTDGVQTSTTLLDGNSAQAASFNSSGFFVGRAEQFNVRIQVPATGSPSGSFKIQGSIDKPYGNGDLPDKAVADWYDLYFLKPSDASIYSTQTVTSSGGTFGFSMPVCTDRYIRVVWTRVSGSISPTVKVQYKCIAA